MRSPFVSRLLSFAAFATIGVSIILAQTFVGGVRGLIKDPAGAVVTNATVTLTNTATGVTRTTTSSAQGEYVFSQIEPATYSITVEAPGFKKLQRSGVIIGLQENINVDITMEIGQVSESVQVTTEVPLIENATASNGQVLDQQKMADLPNLGRNPFLLSKLSNGVIPAGDPRFNRYEDQTFSSVITISGGPLRGNNYLIDGVPITTSQNMAEMIPTLEAVQEMNMQTTTYDASIGRTGGGLFNAVLKTGGNNFHGDLMGYMRETDWNANTFFLNASSQPRQPTAYQNWGAAIGGPVVIPKIYNGRNKTFFWAATEAYRQRTSLADSWALPTAAEHNGDFSQDGGVTIYDPLSSRACAPADNCPAGVTTIRTPFTGNIIPPSQINRVGQAMMNYAMPLPQTPGVQVEGINFIGEAATSDGADGRIFKAEHSVTNWLRLAGSFMYFKMHEPGGNTLETPAGGSTAGPYWLYRHVDATAVSAFITPNPTTVITARYGFNRYPNFSHGVSQGFNPATLGLPASYTNSIQQDYFPTLSLLNDTISSSSPSWTTYWSKNANGSVSKFVGRHNLTVGIDYRLVHTDGVSYTSSAGSFTFNGVFSREFPQTSNHTGADFADLLMGYPSGGQVQTSEHLYEFVRYYGGYVQDDIRVNNKLTVNVGLRYEYQTGVAEKNNSLAVGFNQTEINPISAGVTGVAPYGVIEFAGQNGNPTSCCKPSKTQFGPRLGMAYQLTPNTIFRAGWGMFYAPYIWTNTASLSPGYSQITPYVASNNGNSTPANNLSNPFPNGILQPAGNALGAFTSIGGPISFLDQNSSSGVVHQFSADVQRELPYGIALEVGYIGSRSYDLMATPTGTSSLLINQVPSQYLSLGSGLNKSVANPFYGNPYAAGVIANATVSQAQLLLPFPEYSAVTEVTNPSSASYDSMVVKIQKRLSRGLTFLSTFTWSRNENNEYGEGSGNSFNNFTGSTPPSEPQNYYNLGAEWALASADIPLRWTLSWTYQLPFGKGKQFLSNNRILDYIAGGWSINGVGIIQNGFPLFIFQTNSNSVIGTGEQRPNATGISPALNVSPEQGVNGYINPAAFSQAPAFTFGNISRNIGYCGPGEANWDLSVFKDFRVKEYFTGQFRAEALNAFNTPLFSNPNTQYAPGSATFGHIGYQGGFSRELQLGLRFMF